MQQVHLRVNDAATGQPTPVRIRVTDAASNYHAPFGRLTQFASAPVQDVGGNVLVAGKPWAYIDGACEINLPPGPLHVSIAKGPEYVPLEEDVQLLPGKLALRFEVRRWIDLREQGWHSGDTRAHFLSPHAALLEAQAEDVHLVQLLIRQAGLVPVGWTHWRPSIPNLDAFSGQAPCLQAPGHLLAVNTHNYHEELGSLGLLHCHRVVYPLTFGGPRGVDDWTLADWCGQCHRKGGLVVWTRTRHRGKDFRFGEPLVDLLLGLIDAFEVLPAERHGPLLWYDLLNAGCRVPLAGASGKNSNARLLGSMRTYVQLRPGETLTLPVWIEALRAGRSFVTTGPLLNFAVNEQPPGSVIRAEGPVRVRAEVKTRHPGQRLSILRNGLEIASAEVAGDGTSAAMEIDVPADESCWLAARSCGEQFAHTSPVYVEASRQRFRVDRDAIARLLGEIDRMIVWCQTKARCPTPEMRERLSAGFVKARDVLARKLE